MNQKYKTINLNLLEILNIFIILRIIQERKKKRKRIIKELEKLKNSFKNYILNLENIVRKMNKMMLVIFGENKYK